MNFLSLTKVPTAQSVTQVVTRLLSIALAVASPLFVVAAENPASLEDFFASYCTECHGADKQKGDIRLDDLAALDTDHWLTIFEQLSYEEMPPDDETQPSDKARSKVTDFAIVKAMKDAPPAATSYRRLNKREYGNTVRDLLGIQKGTFDPGEYIYDDEIDHGFDTEAEQLVISNELLIEYMEAARKSLHHALFSSNANKPASHTVEVPLGNVTGTSGRYINRAADHVIGRSGGKDKLYDGTQNRPMEYPGRYTITVTTSVVDRDFYPVRFIPESGPVLMGFGLMQEVAASTSAKAVLKKTFELKDNGEQTFQFDTWIDRDHFPYFSFVNGSSKPITQIRSNIRRRKLPASAMDELYRGPGIKITQFTIEGPFHDEWPPQSYRTTYDADTVPDLKVAGEREQLLLRFAERAFRRPVTRQEIQPYLDFMGKQYSEKRDLHAALIETFSAMMASIDFLYIRDARPTAKPITQQSLVSDSTGSGHSNTLSAYGLANRLSYFLWSSMPDAELLALAESGKLLSPKVLQQQVRRLLDDPRSLEFSHGFPDQWLALDTLGSMPPDVNNPQFKTYFRENLEWAMKEETRTFFHHILQESRSVRDFIDSDYSFLNQGLANLYDVPFDGGDELIQVTFPDGTSRGGLLGHGSILTLTSNGVETSPVVRGHWVLDELLGTPPPPAPKEVPALVPDLNGATTVRDQLAKHRTDPACIECHRQMDPLGMSLEAFDPIGRLRTDYENKQPVTTYGTYKRTDFTGIDELKQIMLKDIRPFAYNLTVRLAEYAKGRKITAMDFSAIEEVVDACAEGDFVLRDIVEAIAVGELLRHQ